MRKTDHRRIMHTLLADAWEGVRALDTVDVDGRTCVNRTAVGATLADLRKLVNAGEFDDVRWGIQEFGGARP